MRETSRSHGNEWTHAIAGMFVLVVLSGCSMCGEAIVSHEEEQAFQAWDKTDRGDFIVSSTDPPDRLPKVVKFTIESFVSNVEELITELNLVFALPGNVAIEFTDCGEENAFWHPLDRKLTMCHEFSDMLWREFANLKTDKRVEAFAASIMWTLYHELGHAFSTVYNLDPKGSEEDFADEFATLMLIEAGPEGEQIALASAKSFDTGQDELDEFLTVAFAPFDDHALDSERMAAIRCMVYGASPSRHARLRKLLGEQAGECAGAHAAAADRWDELLTPFIKPE